MPLYVLFCFVFLSQCRPSAKNHAEPRPQPQPQLQPPPVFTGTKQLQFHYDKTKSDFDVFLSENGSLSFGMMKQNHHSERGV